MCWWAVFFFAGILYRPGPVHLFLLVSIILFTMMSRSIRPGRPPGRGVPVSPAGYPAIRATLICITGLTVMVSADPGERIRTGGQVQAGRGGVPEEEAAPALGAGTAGTENHIFRLPSVPEALRDWLERRTRHHTLSPGTRSLMRALILARRETLDREVLDAYSYLGISHFLALSGLHLGIIGLAVSGAIRSSLGSGWMAQVLLLAVLAVYTSATGSPPSLVRAMALLVAFRLSAMAGLRLSVLDALLAGSLVLLSFRPELLMQVGFQLSFLAVAGIACLGLPSMELVRKRFSPGRAVTAVVSTVVVTVSVQLVTLPLCLERFGRVPLLAACSNILMVVPVTLMLYLAMAHIAAPFLWARELVSFPLNMISLILMRIPGKILFLGGPCIVKGEMEYLPYMLSAGMLAIGLDRRSGGRKWIFTGALLFFILSFILTGSCKYGRTGWDHGEDPVAILEGDPVIIIVPEGLNRYEAFRSVRRFWDEGHRRAGYLVVRSSDGRELGGLGYLIDRTGGPELHCSPYLRLPGRLNARSGTGRHADTRPDSILNRRPRKILIENDLYSVELTVPPFPPQRGSVVNIDEAALGYTVTRK